MTDSKDHRADARESLTGSLLGLRRSRVNAAESEPSRTWHAQDWAEDQRYIDALDAMGKGLKRDALTMLVNLYKEDPGHLFGRALLLTLAVETGNEAMAHEHLEWAIGFHAQQGRAQEACEAYRSARAAFPALAWNEKPLVQVLVCADRCGDRRAVVDATKFLYASYPQSAALPKAFLASAAVQEAEGRSDLARATLQAIIQRFPLDPIAQLAQRKLREVTGTHDAPPSAPSGQPERASTPAATPPEHSAPPPRPSATPRAQVQRPPSIQPEVVPEVVAHPTPDNRMSLLEQATRAPLLPVSDEPWEASLPELPAAPMLPIGSAISPSLPERPRAMAKESEQPWTMSLPDLSASEPEHPARPSVEFAVEATRVTNKAAKEARAARQRRTRPDPRVDPESQPAGPPSDLSASAEVPKAPRLPRR